MGNTQKNWVTPQNGPKHRLKYHLLLKTKEQHLGKYKMFMESYLANTVNSIWFLLLLSCSVVSDSLQPHGLQHIRLLFPSLSPRVCSNSCALSRWCHPTIPIFCHPLHLLSSVFPSIKVFSSESALHIRSPKYWSFIFSISPSNEYSALISLRIDWFDLLAVQGTLESLLPHHNLKASILQC